MAERRMFAKTIVLSDSFLDMPMSTRCLYFTLGMFADDDGFVNSPRGIMRQCGASEDDMKLLLTKKFLLAFDSGVIVIKHWRINNYLRSDRYTSTKYIEEKNSLGTDENGAYTTTKPVGIPGGIPSNGIPRLGKDRLGKDSTPKGVVERKRKAFTPPTLEQVKEYANTANLNVDCDKFFAYFTTPDDAGRTWIDSKGNPVRNWKQKMLTWAGKREEQTAARNRSRNTLLNYDEKGRAREDVTSVELDLDEL